jgi:hypothetical protein
MLKEKKSENILKYLWGIGPWLAVTALLVVALLLGLRISREKKRIKEEKLAAYKNDRSYQPACHYKPSGRSDSSR